MKGRAGTARKLHIRMLPNLKTTPAKRLCPLQGFKIFRMDLGMIVFAVTILAAALFTHYYKEYLTTEEARYRAYMHVMSGMDLDEVKEFIAGENQKYEDLHQELTELLMTGADLTSPAVVEIQRSMEMEEGFRRAERTAEQLYGRENAAVVYDTGYQELFNAFGLRQMITCFLEALAIAALIFQGITNDQASGMKSLLKSTLKGREELTGVTMLQYLIFMSVLCTGLHAMEFYGIMRDYGLDCFMSPGNSLTFFKPQVQLPLGGCVILFSLMRTMISLAITGTGYWIYSRIQERR